MDRFTAMQVFTEVADRSSLTDAATALDMSRAMVSRYLESLETWLGVRLLHRTTRRVSLTDAGTEALEQCRQVLALTRDVQALAGQRSAAPAGRLRITASVSFAQAWLSRVLADFLARYPQTQIEMIALDRAVNLVEERIDLAVRITNTLDDGLVARRLADCRSVLCAAPSYLARHSPPQMPEDLRGHACLTHARVGQTEYHLHYQGENVRVPVSGPFQSNETTVLLHAALGGAGIALLPSYLVSEAVRDGRLVHLLPDCEPEVLGIHASYLSRKHQPLLLRTLLDFLAQECAGAPWDRDFPVSPARLSKRRKK
ncbi:LysR family transcriptional regulator [Rhodoferax sp. WC2427]|uniref:LysR family transcriptional regulator n=1 Tax=Rhodoferax sp. WC2427 TaxID=3234144 RepID=UPI003465B3CD